MSIQVLLMTDIPDLGSEGDVVTVSDGYARNYLFAKKIGAPVTDEMRRRLGKLRREREEVRKADLASSKELAERLGKISCTITVKAGKEGKLFGSVTSAHIAEALVSQGISGIDKKMIVLDDPIKELGVFNVKVKPHSEVEASVKVWVVEE